MKEHPIHEMMVTAMENLREMIDVNTIIGEPIETPDGSTVILPVSKVGFGFAAGGSEFKGGSSQSNQEDSGDSGSGSSMPFGGGTGGGVSINPIGFLVVKPNDVQMIHLDEGTHLIEKLIELAPQAVDKMQNYFQNRPKGGQSQGGRQSRRSQSSNIPE